MLRQAGTQCPFLQCLTWTDVSSNNEMQRNVQGRKLHACAVGQPCGLNHKIQKRPRQTNKQTTVTSEESGVKKQGHRSKSRELCMQPALNTTKSVGKTPKPPHQPDPRTSLPSPHIGSSLVHPSRSRPWICYLVLFPHCCDRGCNEDLSEFLV